MWAESLDKKQFILTLYQQQPVAVNFEFAAVFVVQVNQLFQRMKAHCRALKLLYDSPRCRVGRHRMLLHGIFQSGYLSANISILGQFIQQHFVD